VLGKTIGELALDTCCGAVISRVSRANVDLVTTPSLRLQFGDTVQAFVNNLAGSDAASLAYVTVYPMTTLLRILIAQVLALTLIH
jgi:uncharacterized transporter YbjL